MELGGMVEFLVSALIEPRATRETEPTVVLRAAG